MTVNQQQPQYLFLNVEKCDQILLPGMGVSHFILDFAHSSLNMPASHPLANTSRTYSIGNESDD